MFECVCLQMCGRVVAVSLGELREQRARASRAVLSESRRAHFTPLQLVESKRNDFAA